MRMICMQRVVLPTLPVAARNRRSARFRSFSRPTISLLRVLYELLTGPVDAHAPCASLRGGLRLTPPRRNPCSGGRPADCNRVEPLWP